MRDGRLTVYARINRSNASEPEQRLWLALRAGRLGGVKFRRQKVVGPYIVDFASRNPMLVVEVDGDSHVGRERQDAERTHFLEDHGYRVVRFANGEVMENIDGVLARLVEIIALPLSQPSPLKGRGL